MALLLLLILSAVPAALAPSLFFYFDVTPKIALVLAGAAGAVLLAAPYLPDLWRSTAGRTWLLALAGLAVSLAVSTAWSVEPPLSYAGANWRRFGLITQFAILSCALGAAVAAARDRTFVGRLFRWVCVSGAPVLLYGIAQYFGYDPLLPSGSYHIGEGEWTIVRPPATLGYVTYFATYALHVAFAGAGLALADSSRAWRAFGRVTALVAAAAIVLSGTRAAMLGLAAGIVLLWLWRGARFRVPLAAAAALVALAAVGFYVSPYGQRLRSRTRWYVEDPRGGARLRLWLDALRLGAAHGATGTGPDTFAAEFPRVQSLELARAYPNFYHESPHNLFLDAWTAQGLPGVAALVALHHCRCWGWRRRSDPRVTALAAAALAAGLAQQFSCFTAATALFFFVTLALLAGHGLPTAGVSRRRRWTWAAAPLAAWFVVFGAQVVRADFALREVRVDLDGARLPQARAAWLRFEARHPPGMQADLWYSRALEAAAGRSSNIPERAAAEQEALAAAVRAARTAEERPNALYNLAVFAGLRNDPAATERALRAAIAAAPNWYKPHWTLAQVLRAAGRRDEALQEAVLAVERNAGKNPEVQQLLDELSRQK